MFQILFINQNLYSQKKDNTRIGVFGNSVLNIYNSNFASLDSVPSCCVNYLNGDGISLNLGLFWSQKVSKNLYIDFRLSYLGLSGEFYSNETKPVSIIVGNTEQIVEAKIQHNINAIIGSTNLDINLKYFPTESFSIFGGFGSNILFLNEFNQKESLIEPNDYGTFENKKRVRNEANGSIKNINSLLFKINVGITQDFYLNKKKDLIFSPEISYHLGLNSYLQSNKWMINNIRLGFSIVFEPKELEESPIYPNQIKD